MSLFQSEYKSSICRTALLHKVSIWSIIQWWVPWMRIPPLWKLRHANKAANTSLSFATFCKSPKREIPRDAKECHAEKHKQNKAIHFLLHSWELAQARIVSNSCILNTLLSHSSQQYHFLETGRIKFISIAQAGLFFSLYAANWTVNNLSSVKKYS